MKAVMLFSSDSLRRSSSSFKRSSAPGSPAAAAALAASSSSCDTDGGEPVGGLETDGVSLDLISHFA